MDHEHKWYKRTTNDWVWNNIEIMVQGATVSLAPSHEESSTNEHKKTQMSTNEHKRHKRSKTDWYWKNFEIPI